MRIPLLQPLLDWSRGLIRKLTVSRQTGGGRSWRNSRTYRTWCTLALAFATGEFTYTGQISRREWAPCNVASLYRGGRNFCHRIPSKRFSRSLSDVKKKGTCARLLYGFSLRKRKKRGKGCNSLLRRVARPNADAAAPGSAHQSATILTSCMCRFTAARRKTRTASKNNPARSGAVTAQNISRIFHDIREANVFAKNSVFQNFKFSPACIRTRVDARPSRCCVIRNECK